MEASGQITFLKTTKDVLKRVPVTKPPFGIADLKKTVPPHCFKRSLIRSLSSFFRDIVIIYTFFYLASNYIPYSAQPIAYFAWPLYWFVQGIFLTGFWILGHECGHHAFSEYQWFDDVVGFFIHSVTITPYFSFKYSHRRHHAHTSSIEFEEVFVPKRKSDTFFTEFLNNGPGNVLTLILRITLGFPLYFIFNTLGRDYKGFANHYLPQSAIFNDRERGQVVLSDIGIIAVLYTLYRLVVTQGLKTTLFLYGIPLFVMTGFFVIVTYLNHTHPSIAHYDSTEWDWIRGALSTIDRDFGILNWVFHEATHTHVIHHLFPTIPHYHATVKAMLGD